MGDDITVDKEGISISWKLFVGAVIAMLGFYVASQVAPLQSAMATQQAELSRLKERIVDLERRTPPRMQP